MQQDQGGRVRRRDVQGLRGVAVIGVLVFHAWPAVLPGGYAGVDVFLVLSGFLITGALLAEHARTGRIALATFFANRLRRLAPMAVLVAVATTAAAALVVPPLLRPGVRIDAFAAVLGAENLRLARAHTDYLAAHDASWFQQYWSLGVEEQFYLVWGLALAVVLAAPRLRRRVVSVTVALAVLSFVAMLVLAPRSGSWTFFGMPTRAWEFGLGAVLAVLVRRGAVLGPRAARVVGPVGVLAVGVAMACLDGSTPYPGWATLLPALGTVAALVPVGSATRTTRVLGAAPLRWLGDRSYSLYLWHWPALMVLAALTAGPATAGDGTDTAAAPAIGSLGALGPAIAIAVALALSAVTVPLVEHRLRAALTASRRRGVLVAAVGVATCGAVLLSATTVPPLHTDAPGVPATAANVLRGPTPAAEVPRGLRPGLRQALGDVPPIYADGCFATFAVTTPERCSYGSGARSIVLLGDSHAGQWFTPIRRVARAHDMRVVPLAKSSCPAADVDPPRVDNGRWYHECPTWRARTIDRIGAIQPAVVVIASAGPEDPDGVRRSDALEGSRSPSEVRGVAAWQAGLERTIRAVRVAAPAATVVVLADTPRFTSDPTVCLSGALDDVDRCAADAATIRDERITDAERRAARATSSTFVDPLPWLCTSRCAPVVWNRLVYRDTNHLTDAAARALTPRIRAALDPVLGG